MKTETIIKAFYRNWIARYGTPKYIISDRGQQFMSHLFKDFAATCGIYLKHTTAFHPQCNGKVERLHRTLKAAITAHNSIKWTDSLPSVLIGLRSTMATDSNYSIAQMVFGKTHRIPGEFFEDSQNPTDKDQLISDLQKNMSLVQPLKTRTSKNPNVFRHKDLNTSSHVFIRIDKIRKPLTPVYEGPFKVLQRTDKYFNLEVKGQEKHVSIDRLKPAYRLTDSCENFQPDRPQNAKPSTVSENPKTKQVQFKLPKETRRGRPILPPQRYLT